MTPLLRRGVENIIAGSATNCDPFANATEYAKCKYCRILAARYMEHAQGPYHNNHEALHGTPRDLSEWAP
jgi:hypothetical protein